MIERLDYVALNGPAITSMVKAKEHMNSIDAKLRALIELRVSQINGCVYCVDLHAMQARAAGETDQRLDCLAVWPECAFFSESENAALAWAEAVTLLSDGGAPDDLSWPLIGSNAFLQEAKHVEPKAFACTGRRVACGLFNQRQRHETQFGWQAWALCAGLQNR